MKKPYFSNHSKICTLIIIGLTFFGGFVQNSIAQTKEEKAVADVLRENAAAIEKGDLAALDKIWSDDESVTVFESGNADYGWTNYRDKHLAPELKDFKNLKYTYSDLKVKTDGKTAWATFKYTLSADIKERHVDSGGLGTAVLEKHGKSWQIMHLHTSVGF